MVQKRRRWGTLLLALLLAYVLLLTVAPASQGQPSDDSGPQPPSGTSGNREQSKAPDSSHLLQKAEREGSVRVIVGLQVDFAPEGQLARAQVVDQRSAIDRAQGGLRTELQGSEYQTLREYDSIPYIALELSPQALEVVQSSPRVTDIVEDRAIPAGLAESAPLVQAPTMWANGFTGSGQVVAVLDTGAEASHPFLAGKVVEEACFSGNSNCPNGTTTQLGAGSAAPCTYAPIGCRHGTHVSGIAAGRGSSFSGVAKDANLMEVQVFSRFTGAANCGGGEDPCTLSFFSDQIAGLDQVNTLRSTRNFSSVNISIVDNQSHGICDTLSPAYKSAIDNLRSAGIPTVIASGNNGFTDGINFPACISSAVSVGSTTKSDTVSSFSNSASFLSLLAPGESINSSVPGGGFAFFNGTSMAAPHVAGAWALLKQHTPSASVDTLLSNLQSTGLPVTDTRVAVGVTKPRIRIADAAGISPIDKKPPRVTSTTPANNARRVARGVNIKATFSEPMKASSVNTTTFKLKKAGTSTFLGATVIYDPATKRATLNPNNNLRSGRTYVVTVTTGAQDEAGNSLDQSASVAGKQKKTWKFTVR
jgi:subtilisin